MIQLVQEAQDLANKSAIEHHLEYWINDLQQILDKLQTNSIDSYDFYYYMKDFIERVNNATERYMVK